MNIFRVIYSVVFKKFGCVILEHFPFQKRSPIPVSSYHTISSQTPMPRQYLFHFLSLYIDLFWTFSI